ncbi:MAG: alkaline phosphatase, partial [Sandaracinaceae bacterium]
SQPTYDASPESDHCVRLRLDGLEAGTTYYYRFTAADARSHTGRFRTAAAPDADVPVRFAVLSCQDYVGRYYNPLLRLLDDEHDDLDFVLHLGDYVYETTGDPGFMMAGGERAVRFEDEAGAISLGDGTFFAARSVSNYRDLYKTFRTDELLQRLHERFAFVVTWDDHEFSDDSHGATATYSDGLLDETDVERKQNAEQAYFEYMPVARMGEATGALTASGLFPDNRLYRDFRFGQNLSLAVTDYRSFRADHPTPEDAFPGAVVLDQAEVMATLSRLVDDGDLEGDAAEAFERGGFRAYVDLDASPDLARAVALLLEPAYAAEGVPADRASMLAARYGQGLADAAVVRQLIEDNRASLPSDLEALVAPDPEDTSLPRGLPYLLLGKSGLVGQLGARYLVVQRTYELVQAHRHRVLGQPAVVFGEAQEAWLRSSLAASDATWKMVGNSVNSTSLILDLEPFATMLPPELPGERMLLNVDHWDGFPEKRRQLMDEVYRPANAVLLGGDIHACLGTDFGADADNNRVIELTTPGVSSGSWSELLERTGNSVDAIRESGLLTPVLGALDLFQRSAFPELKLGRSSVQGAMVVGVDAAEMVVEWHLLPEGVANTRHYDAPEAIEGEWERLRQVVPKQDGKNGPLPGDE